MGSADRAMAPSAAPRSVIIASRKPRLRASVKSPGWLAKAGARWDDHFRRPELALLRDLLLNRLLRRTGHRYRVRLAVGYDYGLGKRARNLAVAFSGSPAECR